MTRPLIKLNRIGWAGLKLVIIAGLLAGSVGASKAAGGEPWAQVNGYWAGMKKSQAKAAGYADCHYGARGGEMSDRIYCEIPAQRLSFAGMTAKKGVLVFGPRDLETVAEVQFDLPERKERAIQLLEPLFGAPNGSLGRDTAVWVRDSAEYVSVYGRIGNASLSLKADKALTSRFKGAATEAAKRKETLKSF